MELCYKNDMLLWDKIETQSNVFSSTEQKLISYIKKNPQIIFKTITEVIEESGVGYGTIIRFCKKIGCSGFQDFKIRLATENNHVEQIKEGDNGSFLESYRKKVIKQLNSTVRNTDEAALLETAQHIIAARKIIVIGFGGSFPMAQDFVYRLLRLGFGNISLDADEHVQAYRVSLLSPEDLLVVFSFSGATKGILETVKLAKKAKARIVSFTNHIKSPLIELSDCSMITAIKIPALQAELSTRLPFYFLIEVLTTLLYENYPEVRKALELTYDAVADKQI
ncbi:MurR/RpiR family transcriptional regulator [Sediminispirochaeta smaragdinae]|jgi:DNA-binding MurR/RpiR family transcriptional regulator|uniref:Transcriptional regulator, RpiR family n=1 Tax=Sediminispirochaeta smaragdinae (strain DSM 11293 / JCM 15392 / SEBR 4228) TaxID=573413 RepID=E1R745_SEDSS|nr:MurR/RpiR family transcriptional regulator [Sediminispirochaeta smaragdinae]ADK81372.1 transcriptional regulator, RpiR family [Sediminispirochaeta smaragdinae DSM 11293]